jgi:glycosyltransferase involved in cell wall biosynthesis
MRVLYINPIGELGGAERNLLDMIWSLRQHAPSIETEVLSFAQGPLTDAVAQLGAPCHVLPLPRRLHQLGESGPLSKTVLKSVARASALLGFVAELKRWLAGSPAQVLHTNGLKAHVLAAVARASRQKLVWHMHDFVAHRPAMRRLMPLFRGRADRAIAVSEAVATDLRPLVGRLPVEVILNGIRTDHFQRQGVIPLDLDAEAHLPAQAAVRIGLIATYAHWKGHELFIDAVARTDSNAARYYIIGGPVYGTDASQVSEAQLRQRIRGLNLENVIGLIPFQQDPARVYAALDVVVHASTRPEPFGRTVAEALSSGCAVVAAGAGGVLEQITHLKDGLLFKAGSAEDLSAALRLLLTDTALRNRIASAGPARAREALDAQRLGPQVAAVYRALLDDARRD